MKRQVLFFSIVVFTACNGDDPTYHGDVKTIIDENCATCHVDGGIAPFALTTFDESFEARAMIANSVAAGTMPPWPPNSDCNEYHYDRSLQPDDEEVLLEWANGEALEGDAPDDALPPHPPESLETDVVLNLAEPYAPQAQPDDYRCHIVPWPGEDTRYITGYEVHPDQAQLVHHVIAFGIPASQAEAFRGYDEADEGPGYTCFGSPFPSDSDDLAGFSETQWLASWAPGGTGREFPAGTGIEMEPGSLVVIQVHYNSTTADPVMDDTSMSFRTTDSVDRRAVIVPFTNPYWVIGTQPMSIPAGEESVSHSMSFDVVSVDLLSRFSDGALDSSMGIEVHNVGLHMHELGKHATLSIDRAAGQNECLLDIPDWDFGWQGAYFLKEPTVMHLGDRLSLQCEWDNSVENQPVINGEKQEPRDVEWGEGTGDEMCLGIIYVTEPKE